MTEEDKPKSSAPSLPKASIYKDQFGGPNVPSRFTDPCAEASKASLDCLNRNDYDRDACLDYFQVYRDCKSAWLQKRNEDRRAGRPTA